MTPPADDPEGPYCIVRFYADCRGGEVVDVGFTLAEAQAHCTDPSTRGDGWFDGYDLEAARPSDVEAFHAEQESVR